MRFDTRSPTLAMRSAILTSRARAWVIAWILALATQGTVEAQSFLDAPVRSAAPEGIEMAYREIGAGEPLVLLHGFGGCSEEAWAPFADTLAAHYRLIVPDLRGHGRSTNPSGAFTHRQSAADVLALLDTLGVGRFRAIGISTGGMTLLHAARAAPERVDRLVVVGVGTAMDDEARAWVGELTLEAMPPDVAASYRACAAQGEAQAAALAAQFARFADAPGPDVFAPADLSGLEAPVLLVQGDRDVFFPVEQTVGLYRSLPAAQMWVVPGGGHVPVYGPDVPFVATALRFLSGT